MARYIANLNGSTDPDADPEVMSFRRAHIVVAGAADRDDVYPVSRSDSHGGFDNDPRRR